MLEEKYNKQDIFQVNKIEVSVRTLYPYSIIIVRQKSRIKKRNLRQITFAFNYTKIETHKY